MESKRTIHRSFSETRNFDRWPCGEKAFSHTLGTTISEDVTCEQCRNYSGAEVRTWQNISMSTTFDQLRNKIDDVRAKLERLYGPRFNKDFSDILADVRALVEPGPATDREDEKAITEKLEALANLIDPYVNDIVRKFFADLLSDIRKLASRVAELEKDCQGDCDCCESAADVEKEAVKQAKIEAFTKCQSLAGLPKGAHDLIQAAIDELKNAK